MTRSHNHPVPLLYLITDRRRLGSTGSDTALDSLSGFLVRAAAAGVQMIQIREPDLTGRELFELSKSVLEATRQYGTRLFVNDRADIAAAIPGAGVHLTTRSIPAAAVRAAFGDKMKIGVSTHSLDEVRRAEAGGADFVVFGPVFETESKMRYGQPVGIESLKSVLSEVEIPVLALGGVNLNNYKDMLDAGAAGIAGISIFADASDLAAAVGRMRATVA